MSDEVKYTPMMMQYLEHKKNYQDCIVFYRLGDFYEMFFGITQRCRLHELHQGAHWPK